jgi:O-acetyl-ADP-ribose deacetylase (regulator of RNase III)
VRGNLLDEPVDAIVNAANGHLAHGAGVAGARLVLRRLPGGLQRHLRRSARRLRAGLPQGDAGLTAQ